MSSESPSDMVAIAGNEFSLSKDPPDDCPVVKSEKEDLLGVLDMESLVRDLSYVGKCIRVAYNGIGAAGPKFQDLQIEVQRIGFDISNLCDKSAVTIAKFKSSSKTVMVELRAAYQFLLQSKEYMALHSISLLAELAGKMAKAANDLLTEFESEEEKVIKMLEKTQRRGAAEDIRIADIRAQQERTKTNLQMQQRLAEEHKKLEEEFRVERRKYERKEDKARSSKSGFLNRLGNAITSSIGLGNLFDDESDAERRAEGWKQKSIEKLENEKEQRRLKQDALRLMEEFAHDLRSMEGEKEMADIAVKALHKATGSLKELVVLLKQAVLFWNQLREHCQGLADASLKETVKKSIEHYSKEERLDYWKCNNFKQQMFEYVCKWYALYSVCSTYLQQIRDTQQDLYRFIAENPTYEESRGNLQQLVREFEEDLKSEKRRLNELDFNVDEKIRELNTVPALPPPKRLKLDPE